MPGGFVRILIGFAIMAVVCLTSFVVGDRAVRRMAVFIGLAWTATLLVQITTDHLAEPAIAGDVVCALITLAWAWNGGLAWMWGMVGIEACLLLLHAVLYTASWQATPLEVLANNILSTAALALLVAAGVLSRQPRG